MKLFAFRTPATRPNRAKKRPTRRQKVRRQPVTRRTPRPASRAAIWLLFAGVVLGLILGLSLALL